MYAYTREIGGEYSGRCVSKRIRAARALRRLSKHGTVVVPTACYSHWIPSTGRYAAEGMEEALG